MTIDQAIKKLIKLKKDNPELANKPINIVLDVEGWSKTFFVRLKRISYHGSTDGEFPSMEGTANYKDNLS